MRLPQGADQPGSTSAADPVFSGASEAKATAMGLANPAPWERRQTPIWRATLRRSRQLSVAYENAIGRERDPV
jgi:hypothetical protein